jgi:hypothetical protein
MNEDIAAAIVRLDEAVAALTVEELNRSRHGHGQTPLPLLRRRAAARRLDQTFAFRTTRPSPAMKPASAAGASKEGVVTQPPPFAETERKASRKGGSLIRFPSN